MLVGIVSIRLYVYRYRIDHLVRLLVSYRARFRYRYPILLCVIYDLLVMAPPTVVTSWCTATAAAGETQLITEHHLVDSPDVVIGELWRNAREREGDLKSNYLKKKKVLP